MGVNSLYVLKADKTLWAGGYNSNGQLGDNSLTNRTSPITVVGNHNFKKFGPGYTFAFGIKDNNEVWAWGENTYGQLGNGNKTAYSSPILAISSYSFVKVHAGPRNSGGLTSDGNIYQWGQNGNVYLLGINASGDRSTPTLVAGNHSFIDMAHTYFNCYGLKDNGQLWAWGGSSYNSYLGVGDGTSIDRTSPVLVAGNHSFTKIAVGGTTTQHMAGIKSDGSVWMWGRNSNGALGDLSITNKNSPTLVVGNHSFSVISLGVLHSMGLKANGELWCWGLNSAGQLGTNNLTSTSSPVLVAGNHSFIEIVGGYYQSYALKANGQVWAWGSNAAASLTDGTLTNRSSPILIIGGDTYKSFYSITDTPGAFNTKINIGDSWKSINSIGNIYINIGDTWKTVSAMYINVGDVWKSVS